MANKHGINVNRMEFNAKTKYEIQIKGNYSTWRAGKPEVMIKELRGQFVASSHVNEGLCFFSGRYANVSFNLRYNPSIEAVFIYTMWK